MLTAFVLDGDIPALLRKGAMEALGGRLDLFHASLLIRQQGVQIPLRVNMAGRYILSVVDIRRAHRGVRRNVRRHRPRLPNGGLYSLYTPEGLYRFE